MIGDLPGYRTMWYDPGSIANILSLDRVRNKFCVTFDSGIENEFVVTKPDGNVVRFRRDNSGLYYWDTSEENIERLQQLYADVEDRIEGVN